MATGRLGGFSACWAPVFAAMATALAIAAASAQQSSFTKTVNSPKPPVKEAATKEAPVKAPAKKEIDNTRTRFIIGLERRVEFKVSALTNPNRVSIDLPQIKLDLPVLPGDAPVGVVKSFRYGLSAPGKTRIVIDVMAPVVIERSAIEKSPDGRSDRLVLDIAAAPPEMKLPVPQPAVRRAGRDCKRTIVIDPGHGGEDSGARKFGTIEKDVVLSFSLKLREKLNATGRYKVLMTRDTDVFVPLEQRREFGERHQAQLFIAIHADYTARASARGATIYSLRPQVADALLRSAETGDSILSVKEMAPIKKASELAGAEKVDDGALRDILSDLARRDIELTKERTGVFARSVIGFIGTSTNLMENPDRNAAFVVLKSAKVPSILLELGYLTNEEDAQQLRSDQWRDKVSSSLVTAIHEYFKSDAALRSKDASALDVDGAC
jgi:N-acetylmuramoyl-L-alanine amidase